MTEDTTRLPDARERCPVCDRPLANEEEWACVPDGERDDLCWGTGDFQCLAQEKDWRALYLAEKEAQAETLRLHAEAEHAFFNEHPRRESAERELASVDCQCKFAPGTVPSLRTFTCPYHRHFDKYPAPDTAQ